MNDWQSLLEAACRFILAQISLKPEIAIILGTGLGEIADVVTRAKTISYKDIPGFPQPMVEGHAGEMVIGEMQGWRVAVMRGRPHFYEGHPMSVIGFPVRVLHKIGCHTLIATNAAGGLAPSFQSGDLMLISDHINLPGLAGFNPLIGKLDDRQSRFVSMQSAYDPQLIRLAQIAAQEVGIVTKTGIYAMVGGPSYETPAEIAFLRGIGADAVGMSTAPEVVVARQCGMRVLGISCITNVAKHEEAKLTHDDVLAQARVVVPRLAALLCRLLQLLQR